MKAEEKQIFYDFLKTTSDYIDGFYSNEELPIFSDDIITEKTQGHLAVSNNNALKSNHTSNEKIINDNSKPLTKKTLVMIIGEDLDETQNKSPFAIRAKELLYKMLAAIQLKENENCHIENIIKKQSPDNKTDLNEIIACREYLENQIKMVSPKILLLMGRAAVYTVLDTSEGLERIHGHIYNHNGIHAIPTYHPAELLHDEFLKRPAWEDLKKLRAKLDEDNNTF